MRARRLVVAAAGVLAAAGVVPAAAGAAPIDGEVRAAAAAPVQVPLAVVRSISAGYAGGAVVTTTGHVYAWGNLRVDGFPGGPQRIPGTASTTSVSAGFVHAVAMRSYGSSGAGSVTGWGAPFFGSLGATITTRPSGATPVAGYGAVADVVAAADVTYARTLDGRVLSLGDDFQGQLGDGGGEVDTTTPVYVVDEAGNQLQGITSISQGSSTLGCQLAIDASGRVWAWGTNPYCTGSGGTDAKLVGPFGPSLRAVQVASNNQHQTVLDEDGDVWHWGSSIGIGSVPTVVSGLSGIVKIAQGSDHTLAIDGNDHVWAFGRNSYGELGTAAPISGLLGGPVMVPQLSNIIDVAAGGNWSMALQGDGTVWTWGRNNGGQLGDGGTTDRATPAAVAIPEAAQPGGSILATGLFQPLSPDRLVDTRETGARLSAGGTLPVAVAGERSVPGDASAAWLNVTATNEAAPGYLTVWPCDEPRPLASNVNYQAGVDVPNAVAAPLGGSGDACVFSQEQTDVVVDVNGAFTTEGFAFRPVAPGRLVDTRQGGRLSAGGVLKVQVAGQLGVPADAAAAVLNVTATAAAADGYLTVYPCDQARPEASNVNYRPGVDSPNAVAAALAGDGSACIYSLQPVDVVVDVNGAFTATGSIFNAVTPARLADTRSGSGGRLAADGVLRVQVTGEALVPEGATAAILNVTATGASADGYLTAYPCDQARPLASNVNYRPGVDTPNAVVAPLAADGSTCIYSLRATDVVVDVNGFFQ